MRHKLIILVAALVVFSASTAAVAQDLLPRDNGIFSYHNSPRWRETESHPLRVLAYVLHPVGWGARELIFRPVSSFAGSTEFTRSFFGFREPYDYRNPVCFPNDGAVPNCGDIDPLRGLPGYGSTAAVDGAGAGEVIDDTGKAVTSETTIYFPDVAFEFDKSTLNALGRARVRQVAQILASVPNLNVVVEGHTDNVGSEQYNEKLGQKRADVVMKELTELGIDPARMSPVSMGETRPLFTEEEDWARAANRRVQFSVKGDA